MFDLTRESVAYALGAIYLLACLGLVYAILRDTFHLPSPPPAVNRDAYTKLRQKALRRRQEAR